MKELKSLINTQICVLIIVKYCRQYHDIYRSFTNISNLEIVYLATKKLELFKQVKKTCLKLASFMKFYRSFTNISNLEIVYLATKKLELFKQVKKTCFKLASFSFIQTLMTK